MVGVAQLVEHQVVALGVEGSRPFTHPFSSQLLAVSYQLWKIKIEAKEIIRPMFFTVLSKADC